MSCSCYAGTPVINKDGSCGCSNDTYNTDSKANVAFNCWVGTPRQDANGNWFCDTTGIFKNEPLPVEKGRRGIPLPTPNPCASLVAPLGYKYIFSNGTCAMVVNYDTDTRVQPATTPATPATPATSVTPNPIATAYQNNKSLFLIGGAALAWYLINNQGMKPKQREVVSTTRY